MNTEPQPETEVAPIPIWLRILVILLRMVFYGALIAITIRLSSPQSETIWSVHETFGDLIRLFLGFAVCLWFVFHFFMLPKRADAYTFWLYLGLVVAPGALVIAIAVWR
jgi:hypothetical protein